MKGTIKPAIASFTEVTPDLMGSPPDRPAAAQEANAIITTCKPVMVEMVEYLMKNVYMDENKSKEFLSKVNKIRKEFGDITLGNYKSQKYWEKFKK